MTKEEKDIQIDSLVKMLESATTVYLTDIAGLDAEKTSTLRRLCAGKEIKLQVVKNTLLRKAMERSEKSYD